MVKKRLITALILIVPLFIYLVLYENSPSEDPSPLISETQVDTIPEPVHEPTLLYGIVVDSMEIIKGKIKRNQNLSDILYPYNVNFQQIDELAKKSKEVFDVRKLVINKGYTLICEQDSLKTAAYFVYQPNPVDYIVYQLLDSIQVYKQSKEVKTLKSKSQAPLKIHYM